jgi:hypothetical protein
MRYLPDSATGRTQICVPSWYFTRIHTRLAIPYFSYVITGVPCCGGQPLAAAGSGVPPTEAATLEILRRDQSKKL